MELATNLACVALYDIVIYADDSGSMIFEENGERVNDLKLILGRVAEAIAEAYADHKACKGQKVLVAVPERTMQPVGCNLLWHG